MGKPAVSRDAFRGLFAFYAAKTHHDHKPEAEHSLLRMFGSADDIPDTLLRQWSTELSCSAPKPLVAMDPRVRQITNGNAQYDARDFLRTRLRDLGHKMQ